MQCQYGIIIIPYSYASFTPRSQHRTADYSQEPEQLFEKLLTSEMDCITSTISDFFPKHVLFLFRIEMHPAHLLPVPMQT